MAQDDLLPDFSSFAREPDETELPKLPDLADHRGEAPVAFDIGEEDDPEDDEPLARRAGTTSVPLDLSAFGQAPGEPPKPERPKLNYKDLPKEQADQLLEIEAQEAEDARSREPMRLGGPKDKLDFSAFAVAPKGAGLDFSGSAIDPDKPVDKDSVLGGLTDPQQYKEFGKGIVPGAVSFGGTALKGAAAADPVEAVSANAQGYVADLKRVPQMPADELAAFRRRVEQEKAPSTRIAVQSAISDLLDGSKTVADVEAQFSPPTPLRQRPLYQVGEAVTEFSKGILPAEKGYEESVGRQLGEGLGSMAGGLPAAFLGVLPAGLVFGAAGAGEAGERAHEYDKKEKAAGRPGLTEQQIRTAAILGVAPGTTDILPIETLMHGLPIPQALKRPLAQAIGRIGGQAFVEGFQEGGQQFLQNLIAKEVYNPEQALGEGVPGNVGVGAGVGGIAQTGKELGTAGLRRFAGRRGGGTVTDTEPAPDAVPASPEAPAAPPPLPEQRQPVGPPPLPGQGQAVPPPLPPMMDVAKQGAVAPDQPTAEPAADLFAQAFDLADPNNERRGLWLPAANLDAMTDHEARQLRAAMGEGYIPIVDFDGEGGMLFAKDETHADWAQQALDQGYSVQEVVGVMTGAGTGKPTQGSAVVQQVTPSGAVARESLVTPEQQPATEQQFQAPGREVRTVAPAQALARREQLTKRVGELQNDLGVKTDSLRNMDEQIAQIDAIDARIEWLRGGAVGDDSVAGGKGWEKVRDTLDRLMPKARRAFLDERIKRLEQKRADIMDMAQRTRPFVQQERDLLERQARGVAEDLASMEFSNAGKGPGSPAAPVQIETADDVAAAGLRVAEPTEGQRDAGNYRKGHARLHGLDISIETPKGAMRRGPGWEVESPAAYGYIKGSPIRAKDGEHVDVYVGDNPTSDRAYIVDQHDADTGAFDEPKVVLGVDSAAEATALYDAGFSDGRGPERRSAVNEVSIGELKDWLEYGDATKPYHFNPAAADEATFTPQEVDVLVDAWTLVKSVDAKASPTSEETRLANEAAADLSDYGIDVDAYDTEDALRADLAAVTEAGGAEAQATEGGEAAADDAQRAEKTRPKRGQTPEADARPARYDGPELTADEVGLIVDTWKYVREVDARPKPESLSAYVIKNGGLRDDAREVRHIAGSARERPGLVNKDGLTLDDMALKAWQDGFFHISSERPTVAGFLDTLQDDLHTGTVVRGADEVALEDIAIAAKMAEELDDYGISPSRFRSERSLRAYLDAEPGEGTAPAVAAEGAEGQKTPLGRGEEGTEPASRGRAGGVRAPQDADQRGAEPAESGRPAVEDRGPERAGPAGRKPVVEGAPETGPSDTRRRLGKGLADLRPTGTAAAVDRVAGQTSFLPEPTTREKTAAAAKAKERRGGKEPADAGLFSSDKDQTDLVDQARSSDAVLERGRGDAREYVLSRGKKNSREYGAMVLPDGRVKPNKVTGQDTASFLMVTPETAPEMWTGAPRSVDFHHNHPRSSSFSRADYTEAAVRPGLRRTYVHGHDGSQYWAALLTDAETLGKAYDIALDATETVSEKGIGLPRYRTHLIALMLREAGVIEYEAQLAPKDAQKRVGDLRSRIGDEWAVAVEEIRDLKGEENVPDRGARPARSGEGVAGASAEAETAGPEPTRGKARAARGTKADTRGPGGEREEVAGEEPVELRTNAEGFALRLPFQEKWGNPRFDETDREHALGRLREIQIMPVKTAPWNEIVEARHDIDEILAQLLYYDPSLSATELSKYVSTSSYFYAYHLARAGDSRVVHEGKRPPLLLAKDIPSDIAEFTQQARQAVEHMLSAKRRGVEDLFLANDEQEPPAPRERPTSPVGKPERIGEKLPSGFYFLAGRKLAEVPEGLFPQGGRAVINWLRKEGVKRAEINHFQLVEKFGDKKPVTRDAFAKAIAERMFDFRRKTSWLNPERSRNTYEMEGTRAFRGPRIPGQGIYFEDLQAFPKKLAGGETFAPGMFQSPHWEDELRGTWASRRGSLRDVPNWGRMLIDEEKQSDYMQGAIGRDPNRNVRFTDLEQGAGQIARRPRIGQEEYLELKGKRTQYNRIMGRANELAYKAVRSTALDDDMRYAIRGDLAPTFSRREYGDEEWTRALELARNAARDVADQEKRNSALADLDKLAALRAKHEEFFAPGAVKRYGQTEMAFTPESPLDDSYRSNMVRSLLLDAAKLGADSIAIPTTETNDRIQMNTTASAGHFYDQQMKPRLERELRTLTGDGSIVLEMVALPKAIGAPKREKPYTVWAAKVSDAVKQDILASEPNTGGLPMFAIAAFHASPHDFGKFSIKHINTGEGNQQFGPGLYFAENDKVTSRYLEEFTARDKAGHLYQVNIHAEPDDLLDWEKPIKQQSPKVRAALIEAYGSKSGLQPGPLNRVLGRIFSWPMRQLGGVSDLVAHHADRDKLRRELVAAGIPGIRYLDAYSRGKGEGTRNYVIFDDSRIEITHKNGKPVSDVERANLMAAIGADARPLSERLTEFRATPKPAGEKTERPAFKSVIPDIRKAIAASLKAGKSVDIRPQVISAVHRAVEPMRFMLPAGADAYALSRLDPIEDGIVQATFVNAKGQEKYVHGTWKELSSARAFFQSGNVFFVRLSARSAKVVDEFSGNVAAELGHELVHLYRRTGRFDDASWGRFLAHAQSLRILDGQFGTYLKIVGDPNAGNADPDQSVRDAYERYYRGRADLQGLMEEEAVAHVVEWHLRGLLSPQETAPVADILDAMLSGEMARSQPVTQREAEMAYAAAADGQEQRRAFDSLGFYSQALEAAKALKQEKGTPEQMRSMLTKGTGVKEAELAATKLDTFLEGKKSVTKADIVKFLEENRVELRESVYEADPNKAERDQLRSALQAERRRPYDERDTQRIAELESRIDDLAADEDLKTPKWSQYSLDPSNPTYRETVIHLPLFSDRAPFDPSKVEVKRNRQSVTQGTYEIFYDGKKLAGPYGDDGSPATNYMKPEAEIVETARRVWERGDVTPDGRVRVPNQQGNFMQGHFSEPNVIAHARTSIQKDASGKPVFLVDELQSDWGQKLRDGGARDEAKIADLTKRIAETQKLADDLETAARAEAKQIDQSALRDRRHRTDWDKADAREVAESIADWFKETGDVGKNALDFADHYRTLHLLNAELRTADAATPGHPLVNTTDQWTTTAFRRLIRQAVEAGADAIAIVPGKVQADRFNIAHHVSALSYEPATTELWFKPIDGTATSRRVPRDELAQYVGKELSERLLAQPLKRSGLGGQRHELNDLGSVEIGGSGMKATYDAIYPRMLSKLLSKMDPSIKMEDKALRSSLDGRTFGEATGMNTRTFEEIVDPILFHTFPLTDKVKASVLGEGMPMFAIGGGDPAERAKSTTDSLNTTGIKVPTALTDWLGIPHRDFQANYNAIARKRVVGPSPGIDLSDPAAVRDFVEDVLSRANIAVRADANTPNQWNLIARNGRDHAVGVRLIDRGSHYKVSTAIMYDAGQLERRLVGAAQLYGQDGLKWRDAQTATTILELIRRGVSGFPSGSGTAPALTVQGVSGPVHPYVQEVIDALERSQGGGGPVPSAIPTPKIDAAAQATLSRNLSEALSIINRVAGKDVRVEFSPAIPISERLRFSADQQVLSGQPKAETAAGFYQPASVRADALIALATNDPLYDLRTAAGHEAWHHVERALASPQELRLLTSPSEMARMRRMAAPEIGLRPDDPQLQTLQPEEIRALAFQKYRREREEGMQPSGIHIGVRRFWDRVIRVFQGVRNVMRGLGYDSHEAIFERARTGAMANASAEASASFPEISPAISNSEALVRIKEKLDGGEPARVSRSLPNAVAEAWRAHEAEIPEGIRAGALVGLEPMERGSGNYEDTDTLGTFRALDGSLFRIELSWAAVRDARSFFHPHERAMLSFAVGFPVDRGARSPDGEPGVLADDVPKPRLTGARARFTFAGALRHEIVHARRWLALQGSARDGSQRPFIGTQWSRLVRHAHALPVMDWPLDTFNAMVGEESVPSRETIRRTYQEHYHGRADFQEQIDQEAVAHMVEAWHHGLLSDADVAPVKGLLERLFPVDVGAPLGSAIPIGGPGPSRRPPAPALPASPPPSAPGGIGRFWPRRMRSWATTLNNWWSPIENLPDVRAYRIGKYQTLGRKGAADDLARTLYDRFAKGTAADKQAAYQYLTDPAGDLDSIASDDIRSAAWETKSLFGWIGQQLVDRGMLPQESYEKYKDQYLPRVYLKHLLGDKEAGSLVSGAGGARPSDMGYLKRRKDLDQETRILLGEITDPGFLAARGIARSLRDLALVDFLEQISQNEDWVYRDNLLVDSAGRWVSPLYLKAEAEALQHRAVFETDPLKKQLMQVRAETMIEDASTVIGKDETIPKGYSQIPDSARYGALRGMWIRKEIKNDLLPSMSILPEDASMLEKLFWQGGVVTKATQYWKAAKVPLNPSTQIRNILSNAVMLNLSGMRPRDVVRYTAKAARDIAGDGEYYRFAKSMGLKASGFSEQELITITREFLDYGRKQWEGHPAAPVAVPAVMLKHLIDRGLGKAGDLYQFFEGLMKVAKMMHEVEKKGASREDGFLEAQKWLFDYSEVPATVRYLRNAPVGGPFITYQYKALPRILEVAATKPWRLAPYVALPYALQALFAMLYGVDYDDVDKLKMALPEYMRKKDNAVILPGKDEHGRWRFFDFGYLLPWSAWQSTVTEAAKGKPMAATKELGMFSGPVIDIGVALKTNIDSFTGRPIADPRDPPEKRAIDTANYAWRVMMPPWMTDQSFAKKMWDAYRENPSDYYGGAPVTMTQAALRGVGLNVNPVEPEKTRSTNIFFMRKEIEDAERRMGSRLRDKRLGDADRERLRGWYKNDIAERKRKLTEYQKASEVHPQLQTAP